MSKDNRGTLWNGQAIDGPMDESQRAAALNPVSDGANCGALCDLDGDEVAKALHETNEPAEDTDLYADDDLESEYQRMRAEAEADAKERKEYAAWENELREDYIAENELPQAADLDDACEQLAAARGIKNYRRTL